jgi:hypothetical protein
MTLNTVEDRKKTADWLWDNVFERFKKGEATQDELVFAMDLCNKADRHLMKLNYRNQTDSRTRKAQEMHKYYKDCPFYRIEDGTLFISDGNKFIAQTPPYEEISFDEMDKTR